MYNLIRTRLRRSVAAFLPILLGVVLTAPAWAQTGAPPPLSLFPRPDAPPDAQAVRASVPLPRHTSQSFVNDLIDGGAHWDGRVVQATPVAYYEDRTRIRRILLRWMPGFNPERAPENIAEETATEPLLPETAGWDFSYTWLEGNRETLPWKTRLRNAPLEETEYEMYQLDLHHGGKTLGLRLGLRHNNRIYWWQFVRADFIERGPVYDILRVGGPIYNEESSIQSDIHLVLYANGVIEAYAHFVNHQREGAGTSTHGIPVLAFQVPGKAAVDHTLDGSQSRYALGPYALNMGTSAQYADAERPGSLRTEGDAVVWQPWLDQEIWGEMLVEDEGIPEHRIIRSGGVGEDLSAEQRGEADTYWVTKIGDAYIPRGVARTVPFTMSLGEAPPDVAVYQAPGWWHAEAESIPTHGYLPAMWWAAPHTHGLGNHYYEPHPRGGVFELGRSSRDSDGSLGAALCMLGDYTGDGRYNAHAPLPAYWWADIAVDHVEFTCHEIPKYSWQWVVQPYTRWVELVHVYWENGDPYLLETASFVADAYYRFFKTNRPHRFVGRDALGCAGLLALYEATGYELYLDRVRDILRYARQSYSQTGDYWPGHQSGVGPNGVARQPDYNYIPMLLAQYHAKLLAVARGTLPPEEEAEAYDFMRFMVAHVDEKGPGGSWDFRRTGMGYEVLAALADKFPAEADLWQETVNKWNDETGMPEAHDGAQPYTWVTAALRFDSWVWGAAWTNGTLRLEPKRVVLDHPKAPKTAQLWTPRGWITLRYDGTTVTADQVDFPVTVDMR